MKNPNFSRSKVFEVLEKKSQWIWKKVQELEHKNCIKTIYEREQKVLLFGSKESIHVDTDLPSFYKEKSAQIIPALVHKWENNMGVISTKLSFRKAKRRWGSCNSLDELSFNSSIAQLPLPCIEYIVVHELAHIKHKNHQKAFWDFVASTLPDYKKYEKSIKEYSPEI